MGKGSSQTTTVQSANPSAVQAANAATSATQSAATAPYQYYPGQLVAGLNSDQGQAINTVAGANGIANPYINAASSLTSAATQPIGASQINQFMNPYVSDAVNTTSQEINQNNAIQQNQLQGNAAALGALGGNRVGIAQAALANQQDLAENATISGMYNTGYQNAVTNAQTQNSQDLQGAYEYGNLGTTAQNTTLAGANAQLATGGLEQQQQQNVLNQAYSQWEGAQQYPFQVGQYLSNTASEVAPLYGGQSSTTTPAPSTGSQVVGGLETVAGLAGAIGFASGGRTGRSSGGRTDGRASLGELVYYFKLGHAIHRAIGGGLPVPPAAPPPQSLQSSNGSSDLGGIMKMLNAGGMSAGGIVAHYDDGGGIPYQTGPVSGQDQIGDSKHAGYIPEMQWTGAGHFGGPAPPEGTPAQGSAGATTPGTGPLSQDQINNLGTLITKGAGWLTGSTNGIGDSMGDNLSLIHI